MKAILILIASIAFAVAPFLSPEFGGFDPNRYPIPQDNPAVQPAGWAFGIWGLIYLFLIAHSVVGLLRYKDDESWDRGRIALFVSLVFGTFWLPVALASPIWATLMIWVMLISSLVALHQMREAEPAWQASLPVALYAGWLTAASFVSIGLLLAGYGVMTEYSAAITALSAAFVFSAFFQIRFRLWSYGIAVGWGFLGISTANAGSEITLSVLAAMATALIVGFSIYCHFRPRKVLR